MNLEEDAEEIRKIQQQQDVLLCQYDGKHAQNHQGKTYCIYTSETECKYRMSFKTGDGQLDYLCLKWAGVSQK